MLNCVANFCLMLFLPSDFHLNILHIDFKYVNTCEVTRSATANKITVIVPKRAANDLCFHVSDVKFWNSLPNHSTSILNFKPFMTSLHFYYNFLADVQ